MSFIAVVIVVGADQPGIVARVTTVLAQHMINIRDISQNYAHEFFTMILVVEFADESGTLKEVEDEIKEAVQDMGVFISIQHEDVFRVMHRI
jgi:ACT domain-containing protein